MSHADRYTTWRQKHPEKDTALRKAVCLRLGMRFGEKSDAATLCVTEWCQSTLGALLGWGEEAKPEEPPMSRPAMPASGEQSATDERFSPRDAAAGERSE